MESREKNNFYPFVSIAIPVYNGENFLREAINSALAQTYKNIEILVINDGSMDETDEIAKSYGNKIRYFKKENGGVATALNLALREMKGDYFSWLSHDDVYLPEKVEAQIRYLSGLKNKETVLYSDYECMDSESRYINTTVLDHTILEEKREYAVLRGAINGITLLIPKKAFEVCGYFDESLRCTQDYALWFKMIWVFSFRHMPQILVRYRIHDNQDTNKNPLVITEGSDLWIHIIKDTPIEKKRHLEGHEYFFYVEMKKCLRSDLYPKAVDFCQKNMERILRENGLDEVFRRKDQEIVIKDQEITFIKSSKFWKLRRVWEGVKWGICNPKKVAKKYLKNT